MSDLIDRQSALNIASGYCHPSNIAEELAKLPSAQPEPLQIARDIATIIENEQDMRVILARSEPHLDEWCVDCSEYDSVKHCCPRFNRVIRAALDDAQPRWIPCSERLPDYNVPVLTWDSATYQVEKRIPCVIGDDGEPIFSEWWVSDEYDEDESLYYPNLRDGAAIAWMPLPEPPKEDE